MQSSRGMLVIARFSYAFALAAALLTGCAGSFDVAPKTAAPRSLDAEPDYDAKPTQVLVGSGLTLFFSGLETMAVIGASTECNGVADASTSCRGAKEGAILGGLVVGAALGATIYAASRPAKPSVHPPVASSERAR